MLQALLQNMVHSKNPPVQQDEHLPLKFQPFAANQRNTDHHSKSHLKSKNLRVLQLIYAPQYYDKNIEKVKR